MAKYISEQLIIIFNEVVDFQYINSFIETYQSELPLQMEPTDKPY